MKNLNKIILALAAVTLPLVSCQKVEEWKPGEPENGPQVYFSADAPSSLTLSSQESSFTVDIYRVITNDALTVNLSASGDTDPFTIPSSVNFGAGQNKASIPVEYDFDAIGFDVKKTITFSIADEAQKTQYGNSAYSVTVQIPSPWTLLGKAQITDYYYMGETRSFNLYQNDLDPNLFRLDSPFVSGDKPTLRVLQPGEVYKGTTVTMKGLVGYDDIDLELNTNYNDEVYMVFPGRFTSYSAESAWVHNTVLAYQENGLPGIVQLAPYYYMFNTGGWNKTAVDGMVEIVFPGYVILDTSVSVEYTGIFSQASDGATFAQAEVELGADVEEAKVAVVPGDDPEAAAAMVIAGEVESESIAEGGTVNVAIPEGAEGACTIIVVSYVGGEAQEYGYATFQYFGGVPADNFVAGEYSFGESTITITPVGGYEYLVEGLGEMEDETAWWATYNPNANTFTLSGVISGEEEYGNQFGAPYNYYAADKSTLYAYCSYASEDSDGTDPLEFSVDPESHEITCVNGKFTVEELAYAAGYPYIGTIFEVAAGTKCSPVLKDAPSKMPKAVFLSAGKGKVGVSAHSDSDILVK